MSADTLLAVLGVVLGIVGAVGDLGWKLRGLLVIGALALIIWAAIRHHTGLLWRLGGAAIASVVLIASMWRPIWEDFREGAHPTPSMPTAADIARGITATESHDNLRASFEFDFEQPNKVHINYTLRNPGTQVAIVKSVAMLEIVENIVPGSPMEGASDACSNVNPDQLLAWKFITNVMGNSMLIGANTRRVSVYCPYPVSAGTPILMHAWVAKTAYRVPVAVSRRKSVPW